MFRILIQTAAATASRPATYQWLTETGNLPWETDDKQQALTRYEEELSNYKMSLMTLVKIAEVKLNATTDVCACKGDCNCGNKSTTEEPAESTDGE